MSHLVNKPLSYGDLKTYLVGKCIMVTRKTLQIYKQNKNQIYTFGRRKKTSHGIIERRARRDLRGQPDHTDA